MRVRRLLGMVRLRLWSRGFARCNHCARMARQEWETMCDCWLADVAWWRRFAAMLADRTRQSEAPSE